jgi:hypothetical protein
MAYYTESSLLSFSFELCWNPTDASSNPSSDVYSSALSSISSMAAGCLLNFSFSSSTFTWYSSIKYLISVYKIIGLKFDLPIKVFHFSLLNLQLFDILRQIW